MLHSIADVTPNGTATRLSSVSVPCASVTLTVSAAGGRYGDANIGSARGAVLGNGVPFVLPPLGNSNSYDLNSIYVWTAAGAATVSVTYETN